MTRFGGRGVNWHYLWVFIELWWCSTTAETSQEGDSRSGNSSSLKDPKSFPCKDSCCFFLCGTQKGRTCTNMVWGWGGKGEVREIHNLNRYPSSERWDKMNCALEPLSSYIVFGLKINHILGGFSPHLPHIVILDDLWEMTQSQDNGVSLIIVPHFLWPQASPQHPTPSQGSQLEPTLLAHSNPLSDLSGCKLNSPFPTF